MTARSSRSARRGQALVEFAFVLAFMCAIVITTLNFLPAITARGVVLDSAQVAAERAGRFQAAVTSTAGQDQAALCNQILIAIRNTIDIRNLSAAAITRGGADGCTASLAPSATRNPVVSVSRLTYSSLDNTRAGRLFAGAEIRVCIAYRWTPSAGFLWVMLRGPFGVSSAMEQVFTFRYCGNEIIDPYRSR
jgi:Flp pilus assembly protein TadG